MKIMAVDYGAVRTGLAVCDPTEFLASPVGVITERDMSQTIIKINYAAQEYGVSEIVVGYPLNMDGSEGEKAENCKNLASALAKLSNLPVRLWDERQTTMQAAQYLNDVDVRGDKRKKIIDEVAATIILESYLNYRKKHKDEVK